MKFLNILAITSCLLLNCFSVQASATDLHTKSSTINKGYKEIHTKDLEKLIKSQAKITIVDSRTKSEDDGKRVPKAIFVPLDAKDDEVHAKLNDKNAEIIVYCESSDCPVSKYMAERLVKMGYKNVTRYLEGIEGWESSKLPIEHTPIANKK